MSDNKKYYYLKLKEGFFDTDELIALESLPDGILFSNILLKLYLRSLKHEGRLMLTDRIPYNITVLANIVRQPASVVDKAISAFKELGLVEVLDNGAIYMLDIQNFIGKSGSEGDRKRAYRARLAEEKRMLLGQMSHDVSQDCPDNRPPEIRDKRLEIRDIDNTLRADNISINDADYKKLVDLAGNEAFVKEVIECASSWKGSNAKGKKIKNDYLFIRNWVKREMEKRPPTFSTPDYEDAWQEVLTRIRSSWSTEGWSSPALMSAVKAIGFSRLQQCSSYDLEKMKRAFLDAYKEKLNG